MQRCVCVCARDSETRLVLASVSVASPTLPKGRAEPSCRQRRLTEATRVQWKGILAKRAIAGAHRRVEAQQRLGHHSEGQSSRWWITTSSSRLHSHKNACASLARVLHPFALCLSMATSHLASHSLRVFLFTSWANSIAQHPCFISHTLFELFELLVLTPDPPPLLGQAQEIRKDKREA